MAAPAVLAALLFTAAAAKPLGAAATADATAFSGLERLYFERVEDLAQTSDSCAEAIGAHLPHHLDTGLPPPTATSWEESSLCDEYAVEDVPLPLPGRSVVLRQLIDFNHPRIHDQYWCLYSGGTRGTCWFFSPTPTRAAGKLLSALLLEDAVPLTPGQLRHRTRGRRGLGAGARRADLHRARRRPAPGTLRRTHGRLGGPAPSDERMIILPLLSRVTKRRARSPVGGMSRLIPTCALVPLLLASFGLGPREARAQEPAVTPEGVSLPLLNLRVAGSALRPRASADGVMAGGGGGCIYNVSGSAFGVLNVPLYLPDGATVDTLRMYYFDTSASDSLGWFTVYDLYGDIVTDVSVSSVGNSGNSFNDSAQIDHVVDHSIYSYVLNWRPIVAGNTMQLCGFRIFYNPPLLFADGFESGNTSQWSTTTQ